MEAEGGGWAMEDAGTLVQEAEEQREKQSNGVESSKKTMRYATMPILSTLLLSSLLESHFLALPPPPPTPSPP